MELTKLEISGFKSFPKRTELFFGKGITGILGPNGCGKSNIVDAFRFVLGEQSARAMRGKRVEDFIFSGTEKRRALSYCEVTMIFDNSDGILLSPFTEVSVARRAYRSGESEYLINKTPCRLKDIHDLFRDTGIGKEGYSIIAQGRVSEILSDRSTERREIFEEAAGIAKYRARKEEAERKLIATAKNLIRLSDILGELETRLEPLRLQSETAAEYFKLREELRDIDINLFIHQYNKSTEKINLLTGTAKQLDEAAADASEKESAYASGCAETEAAERELSASISELSQKLVSLSTRVEADAGNQKLLSERINGFKTETERRKEQIRQFGFSAASNQKDLEHLEKFLINSDSESSALNAELSEINEQISGLKLDTAKKEDLLEAKKQSMMEAMNRLSNAKIQTSRLETMRSSLLERIKSIADEKNSYIDEGKKLNAELDDAKVSLGAIIRKKACINKQRNEAIKAVNSINNELFVFMRQAREKENELNAIRSRSKVLSEMKRAHDGYYTSVRRLLNDAERNIELKKRIRGVVAELISVPKEYETAIELSLGAALQNIVVSNEQDAKAVIEYLREHDYGRATLLPMNAMRPRLLSGEESVCLRTSGCLGIASELIEFSPEYKGVVENLLGRTVIVRDIDTGILIRRQAGSSFRIATLNGDILNPGGSMTGGSVQKREFSLLGRTREIEELGAQENDIKTSISEFAAALNESKGRLADANAEAARLSDELKQLDVEFASQSEKSDIIQKYILKNTGQLKKLEAEAGNIEDSLSDISEEFASAAAAENSISEGTGITSGDIRKMQTELYELRAQMQMKSEASARVRIKLTANAKEHDAANAELHRIKKENETLQLKSEAEAEKIKLAQRGIAELESRQSELTQNLDEERTAFNRANDELHRLEEERAAKLQYLDELRAKQDAESLRLKELRERRHKDELTLSRLQIDLENLSDRIWQDYELTYENARRFKKDIPIMQSHLRADEIKQAIKALGEVNASAIEDYRGVKERYDDLSVQFNDLRKAEADLKELIERLTATMEKKFKERFVLIRENFEKTFSELFHGGKAELILSDKNDVLGCNIDIIAQPPGKKLQLLTLLSGGEQALTAIALLFAILKLKPAAFCVLDEIDTSLDDANVENFADYLRNYSSDTQFILITHRKGSMAVCDSLYGVSMEEKGVSSLFSVKFINAENP